MAKWEKFKAEAAGNPLDFQIRVHIIEARELKPRDRNGMSDPVCFVQAVGQKKNTATHKKTTICTWDHLMFFEYKLLPEEFFRGKVKVSVFDANTFLRDVEIGSFEFDVASVYELEGHEHFRKWIALTDSSGEFPGIQGFVKLSICIMGPRDQPPPHSEAEELDEESSGSDLQSMVLMPPSITTQPHGLDISFFKAESLPKMDTFGKCDGFLSVKFGGNPEIKTEIIKKSYDPVWNEQLTLPFTQPTMADLIRVELKDWDSASADEFIGVHYLRLSEIISKSGGIDWSLPRWINFYGSPEGVELTPGLPKFDTFKKMNEGFIEGTGFRGRVLTQIGIRPMEVKSGKTKINLPSDPPTTTYNLRFDVWEANEAQSDADLSVEISIGKFSKASKKQKCKNGRAEFYQSLDDISLTLPTDKTQIPDIFINVFKHPLIGPGKRIGFVRFKATELNVSSAPQWKLVTADVFSDVDATQPAAFLQFGLGFAAASEFKARNAISKPKTSKYQLRAHLYQGRDLPAGDGDAASDPFCIVRCAGVSNKSKTIEGTCFPLWYETLKLDIELPEDLSIAPDINVMCYDWDRVGQNDFLGRFEVKAKSLSRDFPKVPSWYPIYSSDPKNPEGEILASFQLIKDDLSVVPEVKITPEFKECILEISAVGVRDLAPVQLLPVSNPFIQFDCGTPQKVRTKSCNVPSAPNANHLEVLHLPVKVPLDPLFAPPINIKIYDDRLIHHPLGGTRSISLASYIPWKAKAAEEHSEDIPPAIEGIPGAKDEKETERKEERAESVVLDMPEEKEDVAMSLLAKENPGLTETASKLMNIIGERTAPEVKESFPVGFEAVEEKKKDERSVLKSEVERDLSEPTFTLYKVFRAKKKMGQLDGKSFKIEVGAFKGKFRIIEKGKEEEKKDDLLTFYKKTDLICRLYCLEGYQLVNKDVDGNNPYLRVSVNGKQRIKDVSEERQNTSRPAFFKMYEIPLSFPVESMLEVGVWDWDKLSSDDLIGSTKIDLENRYFNSQWKDMKLKPIEYRTLWNPSSTAPQGQLKMWVDLFTPEEAKLNPPEDIKPPLPLQYELRVIIWETKEVTFKDKNMSDIFVAVYPEGQKPQMTDVHWRSENGQGLFNWRMKFPITVPCPNPRLKIQVWDKDILNPNDAICEANLNLRSFFMKAWKNKSDRETLDKEWIMMTHSSEPGKPQGHVLVSLDIMTLEEAKRRPAGFGRGEPNDNPPLPKPDRPETSWNPLNPLNAIKGFRDNIWKNYKWKVIGCVGGCVACIIIAIIIYLAIVFG